MLHVVETCGVYPGILGNLFDEHQEPFTVIPTMESRPEDVGPVAYPLTMTPDGFDMLIKCRTALHGLPPPSVISHMFVKSEVEKFDACASSM